MKTWLKILIGLAVLGIIAAVLVYVFVYNKPHPDYENLEAAYSLSPQELYSAYTGNKEDSQKKYNGQLIELKGALNKIETTDSLVIAVFVFNQGMFGDEGVRCTMLTKYNQVARTLQPGGTVTIKGYCTGFNDTDVILEQCSLVK
jgi:hypothetical protein